MSNFDVCTVISACPFPLDEKKPGIHPGVFKIPAAKLETHGIEVLIVKGGRYPVYMDHDRGSFMVNEPAHVVANAVVEDFCTAQLAADLTARPALFYVEGEYTVAEARKLYGNRIIEAIKGQAEWFRRLVQLADDDWAKTRQHKLITDLQRYAGKALGLQRDWLVKPESVMTQDCPGCASTIPGKALKCAHCGTIVNVAGWNALQAAQSAPVQAVAKP
jgi:hypothetical protein